MSIEGRCRKCGRLIYDVTDTDMLPNVLECQHCHHRNIIRRKSSVVPEPFPETEPGPELVPEEVLGEPEDLSKAASPTFQAAMRDESPGPVPEETPEEVD